MGGYDDNLTAGLGTGGGTAPTAMASGTTAMLDGTLGYFRGNSLRSIRLDTTGTLTAYPGYLDHPAGGGIANFDARTNAGRDTTLAFSERVGYEPFFNVVLAGRGRRAAAAGNRPGRHRAGRGPLRAPVVELQHLRLARSALGPQRGDVARLRLPSAGVHRGRQRRQHVAERDGRLPPPARHRREGARGLPLPGARLHGFGQHQPAHTRPPDRGRPGNGEAALAPPEPLALAGRGRGLHRDGRLGHAPGVRHLGAHGKRPPQAHAVAHGLRGERIPARLLALPGRDRRGLHHRHRVCQDGRHAHQPPPPDAGRHLQQLADAASPPASTTR